MSGPPVQLAGAALGEMRAYHAPADPASIKLDANESPWPLPPEVQASLATTLAQIPLHRYPDGGTSALRAALAGHLKTVAGRLLLGVGSDEVIQILLAAFDRPRRAGARPTVLFPTPTFVMYSITARVQGFEPIAVPLAPDFGLDLPAMLAAIERHQPNLIFLASPNNPTGNRFGASAMQAIAAAAPDSLVVVDEAYGPFAGQGARGWAASCDNVGLMGTLSKVGLAGLRVGWIELHPDLVAEAHKARPPYNLNSLGQVAATRILTEFPDVLHQAVARITDERGALGRALRDLEAVTVVPSEANFFLVRFNDAHATHAALLAEGVQVRRFPAGSRLERYLRITVGTPHENRELVRALRAVAL